MTEYRPRPIDTSGIALPADVLELAEQLAENTHDNWAQSRMAEGWQLGDVRDDVHKSHPCLVPYADLPEAEKEYDRRTALETLRVILAFGYRIVKP